MTSDQRPRHRRIHTNIAYQQQYEPASEAVIETEVLRAEVLHEIYAEIEHLPGRCGQIFKLLFIEGLPTDQIAERFGINVQTVRTQKARAISLILTALLKKGRLATLAIFLA